MSGGGVRVAGAVLWLALLVGAGFLSLRGAWLWGIVLAVIALGGAFGMRTSAGRSGPTAAPPPVSGMSVDEARRILGVSADAADAEIQEAYTRLMRMAHPDAGGTSGLAAQLNAARDRLLKR
ncbi:MAG TPA: DnaJ domain-containing protein [Caulobacteraceae bacterium]|nr:DnaJ domain-containing protein [Caulobacteraceae bacterium]